MITTHAFVKKSGHPHCEHRIGSFVCAQPRSYHKKPKQTKEKEKEK